MEKIIRISVTEPMLLPAGVTHTATHYKVSKSISFDEENLLVNDINTTDLYDGRYILDLEDDDTLYAVTQYIYNNGTRVSANSRITPFFGNQLGVSISDTMVKTPTVTMEINSEFGIDNRIKIMTSDFEMFSSVGEHQSTSWFVKDVDGEVIYQRLKDFDNLTSFLLPDSINIGTKFIIYVIHHSDTNADSNPGLYDNILVSKLPEYKIEMFNKLIVGRYLYFKLKLINYGFTNLDVVVKDKSGAIVYTESNILKTIFRLPTTSLIPGEVYDFEFTILSTNEVIVNTTISTYAYEFESLYNSSKTYLDMYDYLQLLPTKGETSTLSYQLANGYILYGKNNNRYITLGKMVNGILVDVGEGISLTLYHDLFSPEVYVKELKNGDVILAYSSKEDATFSDTIIAVYELNPFSNKFTLVNKYETGIAANLVSGSSITILDNTVYYIKYVDGASKLVKLNPYTNATTEYALPYQALYGYGIVTTKNNNLLLMGGTNVSEFDNVTIHNRVNNKIFKFDMATSLFSELGNNALANINIGIYQFHLVRRHDGKITIFNNVSTAQPVMIADQATYLLNSTTGVVTPTYNDHADGMSYGSTIVLYAGDVLRYTNNSKDPQKVYAYISDSMAVSEIDDNNTVSFDPLNIFIYDNEVVSIVNPVKYDVIKIFGTGIVILEAGDAKVTLTRTSMIVTRDTVISKADFDAFGYSDVYLANKDAKLVITD